MARRFAKVSEEEIVAINEAAFFYPSDLVNTKTTISPRVGEERWIYMLWFKSSFGAKFLKLVRFSFSFVAYSLP